jgi:hypothetical protein
MDGSSKGGDSLDWLSEFDATQHFNTDEKELSRLDEGWAKAALFFRTGRRFGHPNGNLRAQSILAVHAALEARRKRLESNGPVELLHAISLCAAENLPLPSWLAKAYQEALNGYLTAGGPTSLDDAFHGKTMQAATKKKAAAIRQDWGLSTMLWVEIQMKAETADSFDAALSEVLASRAWGIGKTKAREMVLEFDKTQRELSTDRKKSISQIFKKTRNR